MATPSYVLELKLNTSAVSDRNYLQNYFNEAARLSNEIRRAAIKKMNCLQRDKDYHCLLKEYRNLDDSDPKKKQVSKELYAIVSSYGLTQYGLQKTAIQMRKHMKYVHSDVYHKLSDSVWHSVEKYLYGDGRQIHYKKWDDLSSFENKKNTTGIIYDNGYVYINCTPQQVRSHRMKGGIAVSVILPKNKDSMHYIYETSCLNDRTKYCRIVRKMFPSGWRYYVQLVQEGTPMQKHPAGSGRCGIDIGTSTAAVVSEDSCMLKVLDPGIRNLDRDKARLQRKIDRSRRSNNPGNFNPDGTVKKGRKKWISSNTYRKTKQCLKAMERRRAAALKQWQETLANTVVESGNEVYVETMDFKALQKRKKKTECNAAGRYKRKKRFGRSIGMHAPAQFLSILERKLSLTGGKLYKVNTWKFKASQYDHVNDVYIKKKLSKRYNLIDGKWIQRDLYSAFLLMNSDGSLEHADRDACIRTYDSFKRSHDACIERIKTEAVTTGRKLPSCFGIRIPA